MQYKAFEIFLTLETNWELDSNVQNRVFMRSVQKFLV